MNSSTPAEQSLPTPLRWLGLLAWALLVLIVVAVFLVRAGIWQQGLLLYALGCLLSTLILAAFAVAFLLPRFADRRGALLRRALPALPGLALLVAGLLSGRGVPPIHDITTDLDEPPRFAVIRELRGEGSNPLEAAAGVRETQREAYPDITTLRVEDDVEAAFQRSESVARELGWEIVAADADAGRIEAVATTTIMGFKDDVVIRLRKQDGATLVDLRSVSRVGQSDLGANARRIRQFQEYYRNP